MGINLGAAVGPLICGTLAEKVDWSLGFASAGLGMGLGVAIFLMLRARLLPDQVGTAPQERPRADAARAAGPLTPEERDRVLVIFVLTVFVSLFWAGYEQGGGLMNLFTDRSLDRQLLGHEVHDLVLRR
jgi:POT family proton-dependent oligopeptide transporter